MRTQMVRAGVVAALLPAAVLLALTGCDGGAGGSKKAATAAGGDKHAEAKGGHDHSGWWCAEHGIPEEECSLCSPKVAKEMKAKGDWCEVHKDRAKSQCFLCDPSLKDKFAAKYRAKYGTEPPPIEDEGAGKK